MEDLENRSLVYAIVGEFLTDLKQEFGGENNMMKMAELKKLEQRSRMIEKFVQKFRKAARDNRYEKRLLIEEFKIEMNKMIRRKLIEVERPSRGIDQQYKHATNLDKY